MALRVDAVDSVEMVKRQLQHQSGIPFDQQHLLFAHRHLENHRSLMEYGVSAESALYLMSPALHGEQRTGWGA